MGAAQLLTQGFCNCSNLHNRHDITIMRRGLPNRPQANNYKARKVLGTMWMHVNAHGCLSQHSSGCIVHDPTNVPKAPVIDGLQSSPCLFHCVGGAVHAPQFTTPMQRQYQDAFQQEEFEVNSVQQVVKLQLRMPLLHDSPRAFCLCLRRGDQVGYVA